MEFACTIRLEEPEGLMLRNLCGSGQLKRVFPKTHVPTVKVEKGKTVVFRGNFSDAIFGAGMRAMEPLLIDSGEDPEVVRRLRAKLTGEFLETRSHGRRGH